MLGATTANTTTTAVMTATTIETSDSIQLLLPENMEPVVRPSSPTSYLTQYSNSQAVQQHVEDEENFRTVVDEEYNEFLDLHNAGAETEDDSVQIWKSRLNETPAHNIQDRSTLCLPSGKIISRRIVGASDRQATSPRSTNAGATGHDAEADREVGADGEEVRR
ncbi:uncharacterized protein BCR38DRAFT_415767 [Pseudomassariella vexata]|uniref:Uncharacterized protein n=1 Tax=Pseudomassariella vexata TaxID=1141098 RepID=A0A1Y2EHK1_9PEZI|nr:uncharacterized protein BCR38DRAFT_415767 [Pseudomassariella vexata]ORY71039.1 hypothetical protein BCR38DRAFT_415767 [Pseudomassariella vexata]